MNIKDNFVLRDIAGDFVLVPVGKTAVDFGGLIMLNESGALLWREIEKNNDISREELADALCAEYEIDRETAMNDIDEFVEYMVQSDVLAK